jgi:hypothetical protein
MSEHEPNGIDFVGLVLGHGVLRSVVGFFLNDGGVPVGSGGAALPTTAVTHFFGFRRLRLPEVVSGERFEVKKLVASFWGHSRLSFQLRVVSR